MKNKINNEIRQEIWVLIDNRAGTASQAIALANEIGLAVRIINLEYGFFAKLPNYFLSHSLIRLNNNSRILIENINYFPEIMISAGRRAATIALAIKKNSEYRSKIIQIMNPQVNFNNFDLIILPSHDNYSSYQRFYDINKISDNDKNNKKQPQIVKIIGSLNAVSSKLLENEKKKFIGWFNNDITDLQSKNRNILLLIGGSSKQGYFSLKSARKLLISSKFLADKICANLVIINSRRTSNNINKLIDNFVKDSHQSDIDNNSDIRFFNYQILKQNGLDNNPYFAAIAIADIVVISGDSVSMIAEVASSGKKLLIFDEKKIATKKHRKFHQDIIDLQLAERFDDKLLQKLDIASKNNNIKNFLDQLLLINSNNKLSEVKKVANIARKLLFK